MGWTIWLTIDKYCPHCGVVIEKDVQVGNWNYTYNMTPMLESANPKFKSWIQIQELYIQGMQLSEIKEILKQTVRELQKNPKKYKKLNPENNWGSYEGILSVLKDMIVCFEKYPNGELGFYL